MRFDPQSNQIQSDGTSTHVALPPTDHHGPSLVTTFFARLSAALVIIMFGGATLAATILWTPSRPTPTIVMPAPAVTVSRSSAGNAEAPVTGQPTPTEADVLRAYQTGRAFAATGQLDAAIPPLREAISMDPAFAGAHYALGLVQIRRGDLDAAQANASTLSSLDRNLASLLNNLIIECSARRPTFPQDES